MPGGDAHGAPPFWEVAPAPPARLPASPLAGTDYCDCRFSFADYVFLPRNYCAVSAGYLGTVLLDYYWIPRWAAADHSTIDIHLFDFYIPFDSF